MIKKQIHGLNSLNIELSKLIFEYYKYTCPRITIGWLIRDPPRNFLGEDFPLSHIWPNPDSTSHVEQIECHTFNS